MKGQAISTYSDITEEGPTTVDYVLSSHCSDNGCSIVPYLMLQLFSKLAS